MSTPIEQRKLAAIMFTDMVGYSALSQRDDKLALELLEEHRELLREIFSRFHGTEIKTIGDAFLVEFNSALEAAQCAIEIQRGLAKRNADAPADRQIELKIGIHIGDVVHRGGDVYGDGVNIASRIEPLAGAGGICVSMDVERQIRNAVETRFEKLAPTQLKNISVPMELFRIVLPWEHKSAVTSEIRRGEGQQSQISKSGKLAPVVITIAVIAAALLAWQWLRGRERVQAAGEAVSFPTKQNGKLTASPTNQGSAVAIPEKSIAVLPFDNLSDDKSNAYFAEGIQDEILTRLSKIAALKVISRTSTQKYKSAPDNLREIAQQLGVANLVEGSVQKIANAVHVNVQLIRAATDEHLWAESYNRKLDDVFAVEGEVANAIADQLRAKLSGAEKQEVTARPTSNPEAYDAYLHGLAFFERPDVLGADQRSAIESFETAVRLDPNFALAWAKLAKAHSNLFFDGDDTSAARSEAAHAALQKALQLQPDLLETRLSEAYYHYFIERDYDRARHIFEEVHQQSPNNPEAPLALALIARRQGRWDEALPHFHEALELDPRSVKILMWTSDTYKVMRQFSNALKFIDRVLDIAPGDNGAVERKAGIYDALGQLDQADAVLAQMHGDARDVSISYSTAAQRVLRRDCATGITLTQSGLSKLDPSRHADRGALLFLLARFQELGGNAVAAKANYSQSRAEVETLLQQQPDNPDLISALASVDAGLGNKDAALREADQAIAKLPATKDALLGPNYEEARARILARFGENDAAITALRHLLAIPYVGSFGVPITPALLRLDPDWDNVRADPRFEKLCEELNK